MKNYIISHRYTIGTIVILLLIGFIGFKDGWKTAAADTLVSVEEQLEDVQIQYQKVAAMKRENELHVSLAKEQASELLLLHGRAERLRTQKSLLLALMGKGEGK